MRRGAGAAPPRPHYVGFATLVLSGLCVLGIVTSRAVAASPLEVPIEPTTTIAAAPPPPPPAPDPKPAPRPDPMPARPKQPARQAPPPPPPPPPPPVEPTEPRATATTVPTTPPKARAKPAVRPKPPARKAAATPPRPAGALRRPARPAKVARRKQPAPVRRAPALDLASAPFVVRSEPSRPIASPAILPLVGLGLLLLLGASVASARWVPWPELAEPLYAHRRDLATVGVGVIALAFLWLNAAVLL